MRQDNLQNSRRRHILQQQMQAIRKELGEDQDDLDDLAELESKLAALPLSAAAKKVHH